ncbi:fluoride efflux transporter FluC [Brevibacterium sp. FAM 27836]|uniref:fluoride efflux transporter FluC n=1 Tax=Brevibacterium sp. FAM 27836 TaxID=3446693 RepID=UPI003F515119
MTEIRPLHLRLPSLGLAVIGGSLGTAAREAIGLVVADRAGIPVAILGINLLGAFCLGLLLSGLSRLGPDAGLRQKVRILVGTGFMGGFTTYSALATDTASLLGDGRIGAGLAYGLGTVVIGGLATWAGIAVASTRANRGVR